MANADTDIKKLKTDMWKKMADSPLVMVGPADGSTHSEPLTAQLDKDQVDTLFFFIGKWTFDVLYLVAERRVRGTELAMQLLLWSPLAATVTALAGIVLLLVLRPVLGRSSA